LAGAIGSPRLISVDGVRKKNGRAAANQKRNKNRHDIPACWQEDKRCPVSGLFRGFWKTASML
jgi:hypothetical protein